MGQRLRHSRLLIFGAFVIFFWMTPFLAKAEVQGAVDYTHQSVTFTRVGDQWISPIIRLERPFNVAGLRFAGIKTGMEVNFSPEHEDTWEPFEIHDDGFGPEAFLLSSPTSKVQFRKDAYEGEAPMTMEADLFFVENEINPFISSDLYAGPLVAESGLKIISREDWGADETLRYWSPDLEAITDSSDQGEEENKTADTCADYGTKYPSEMGIGKTVKFSPAGEQLIWPLQYSKSIRKIVVHHTDSEIRDVNGDDRINSRDYGAIVRAIYHFHTVTRGWGDIGYNYLIDPLGNIYEGRYGGDKVIGAHVLCHNNGALGIAVIGNYQENEVPEPALQSLNLLIAQKTKQFNIDPTGTGSFRGKDVGNIVGHKDLRSTACPGEKLHALLPRIRERVNFMMQGIRFEQDFSGTTFDYNADFEGDSLDFTLEPNERKKIRLTFKNTGKEPWDQNTWLHVPLNDNPNARIIPLIPDKSFVASNLEQPKVNPGQTGSFEIEIEAGYVAGTYDFELAPVVNGRFRISRAITPITFSVGPVDYGYEVVKMELPPETVFQGQKVKAWVELKNTGNITWQSFGPHLINLGTARPRDHRSVFIKNNPARIGYLADSEVKPGETGRFYMELEVPVTTQRKVVERFAPVIEGVRWLDDKGLEFTTYIQKPRHLARLTKLNPPKKLMPGEVAKISVLLENQGDLPWGPDTMSVSLKGNDFRIFKNRMTPQNEIKKDKNMVFDFWIQAPYQEGTYSLSLNSKFGRISIPGGSSRLSVEVPLPVFRAKMVEQGTKNPALRRNEIKELTVKIKNLGNTAWVNNGPNAIYLAPSDPVDRQSIFYVEDEWISRFRTARMEESEVKPGDVGTFKFKVRSTQNGIKKEAFQLVIEKVGWIEGSTARWDINVARESAANAEKTVDNPAPEEGAIGQSRLLQGTDRPFRVRLSYQSDTATLTADKSYEVKDESDNLLFQAKASDIVSVTKVNNVLQATKGDVIKSATILRFIPAQNGIMEIKSWEHRPAWNERLNDNRFRGVIELQIVDDAIATINELPLEDYLKGLAEAGGSDPLEKKKAIAVLARSYARFYMADDHRKFPGLPYDGSDDPAIFQKYLGYGAEIRSPSFVGAVALTENEVVTYKGKLIKTPYFSQSDGRTRSAEEVWGWKDTPYLKSVPDPWCEGMELKGHGVGLSGCGAKAQALEGKTYDDIISYYFQGVEIQELKFE